MEQLVYLHLKPGSAPPQLTGVAPFKAVVVIEADVSREWQNHVSDWLVRAGCRYMMAWGRDCSVWDDAVDWAHLAMFDYGEISEEAFVMTTWHNNDSLAEVFWFSQFCAKHSSFERPVTYIMHISQEPRAREMLEAFEEAIRKGY